MTKYKLVGLQLIDYNSKKTGLPQHAVKLHAHYNADNIEGQGCETFFVAGNVYDQTPLKIGQVFTISRNGNFVTDLIPLT